MSYRKSLLKWTQSAYGVIHSLAIADALRLGNLESIGDSVERSVRWLPSNLGFTSSVADKKYKPGSIRLNHRDAAQVIVWLQRSVAEMLLVDLASLCDELLQGIMKAKGISITGTRFFAHRVKRIAVQPNELWSQTAMYELNAIRNCIIHSDSMWNKENAQTIKRLHGVMPSVGSPLDVGFREVLNYKRAVRAFLGAAAK